MPHDKNGTLLQAGDNVLLACRIKAISENETACNVTAEVIERPDGESYIPEFFHNSRFYEKTDIEQLKSGYYFGNAIMDGLADLLGLEGDIRLLTCWEEMLGKVKEALRRPDGPSQFAGDHVAETKSLRKQLDDVLQQLHAARGRINGLRSTDCPVRESRERSLATTKLQEAIIWLGMDLKAINEESPGSAPNPYPNSYDPASPVIEPTADGLKL